MASWPTWIAGKEFGATENLVMGKLIDNGGQLEKEEELGAEIPSGQWRSRGVEGNLVGVKNGSVRFNICV